MSQFRITPRAISDLVEIWNYIADDSEKNADTFIDKLYDTLHALSNQPGMGRRRDELASGVQSFPFGRYIVFYHVVPDAIEVLRVLHGTRDIETIF